METPYTIPRAKIIAGELIFGMEGLKYDEKGQSPPVEIFLEVLKNNGVVDKLVRVQVRVAPWTMISNLQPADKVFVVTNPLKDVGVLNQQFITDLQTTVGLKNVVKIDGNKYRTPLGPNDKGVPRPDVFPQDAFEIGYSQMPEYGKNGALNQRLVVMNSPSQNGLHDYARAELLGPNFGWFEERVTPGKNNFNQFGNLEVSPPVTVGGKEFKLGRIIYGSGTGKNQMDLALTNFLQAQRVQDPISIDTSWLFVQHLDEIVLLVPNLAKGAKKGSFKVLMPSPQLALQILLKQAKPEDKIFNGPNQMTVKEALADGNDEINWVYNVGRTVQEVKGNKGNMAKDSVQFKLDSIKNALMKKLGLQKDDFIDVPVIFTKKTAGRAAALSANLANSLVFNNQLILPKPFGPIEVKTDLFQADVQQKLKGLNLKLSFIDEWTNYHNLYGEIHCATNATRQPLTGVSWWQQKIN